MAEQQVYKMYLMASDTLYYVASDDGTVTTTTTKTPLRYAPKNWDKTELIWKRNEDYKGVFRSLKTEYQFVLDGASILRDIFYNDGVEGFCILRIEIINYTDWTYSLFQKGELNFKTYADLEDFVNIAMDDDSVFAKLKANASIPYEIDCNRIGENIIILDGITLYGSYFYSPQEAKDSTHIVAQVPAFNTGQEGDFPVALPSDQEYSESFEINPLDNLGDIWADSMFNSSCYLLRTNQQMEVRLRVNHGVNMKRLISGSLTCRAFYYFMVVDSTKEVIQKELLFTSDELPTPDDSFIEYDVIFDSPYYTVPSGCQVYYMVELENPPPFPGYVEFTFRGNPDLTTLDPLRFIQLDVVFKISETFCAGITYYDFFRRLSDKVLEDTNTADSNFLTSTVQLEDNVPALTQVTSGDSIRGFGTSKIRTTFNEMFDDASARWMLGLGLNSDNKIILERLWHFFDDTVLIADLGNVKDLELTSASDMMFNQIKVGQKEQDYDELNGRDEYNQSTTFKLPFKRIVNGKDTVSPYRWDMYGIETYRANLTSKKTTDSESDNDTFVLSTEEGFLGNFNLRRPDFTDGGTVSGVLDSVYSYNIDLSAARQMRRNYPYLASVCHLRNGEQITFQTTDKNPNLVSKFNTVRPTITENADINVDDLGSPLFLPIYAEFESEVPINLYLLLQANPYGYFTFTFNGVTLRGFMLEAGMTPALNSTYRWKMILTPSNDINLLKR